MNAAHAHRWRTWSAIGPGLVTRIVSSDSNSKDALFAGPYAVLRVRPPLRVITQRCGRVLESLFHIHSITMPSSSSEQTQEAVTSPPSNSRKITPVARSTTTGTEPSRIVAPVQEPPPPPEVPPNQLYLMKVIEDRHCRGHSCIHVLESRGRSRDRRRKGWIEFGVCRAHPCYCWLLIAIVLVLLGAIVGVAVGLSVAAKHTTSGSSDSGAQLAR